MSNTILLLQLYSLERLQELSSLLNVLKQPAIAISANIKNKKHILLDSFINKFQNRIVDISYHENYGVDIAPFLHQLSRISHKEFPYFIKIHSKQSLFGKNGDIDWGTILIDSLIGDLFNYQSNISSINSKHIGTVSHGFLTLKNNQGRNVQKIDTLCNLIGIDYSTVSDTKFAAGSMFLSKTKIFQKYLSKHFSYLDTLLSTETGKVYDGNTSTGTYSHALERIFGYIITSEGLKFSPCITQNYTIFNSQYRKLHLRITYNKLCYLTEDLHVFGYIHYQDEKYIDIKWYHFDNQPIVRYKKFDRYKIIKQ